MLYLEHKREQFDAMRAYHESEISHTNHAITMLLAIAGGAGAIVLATLFPQSPIEHLPAIAFGLLAVVWIFGIAIAWTTSAKIDADHASYRKHGEAYDEARVKLGLIPTMPPQGQGTGEGTGYKKTEHIIWTFAALLCVLSLCFVAVVQTIEPHNFSAAQVEKAKKCQVKGGVLLDGRCVVQVE